MIGERSGDAFLEFTKRCGMLGTLRFRREHGDRRRREDDLPLVGTKFGRFLEIVQGRDILDVGRAQGPGKVDLEQTSHTRLAEATRSLLGIDTAARGIKRRQVQGYNVAVADAQSFELGRKFDVIVTADLIEHLGNSGAFLERAGEHLRPGGLLCIVTPNALSLNNALKSLAGLRVRVNAEHTCWYDRTTLRQLLARYGFQPVEEYWQDDQTHPLTTLALRLRRNLAAHLIVIAGRSKMEAV